MSSISPDATRNRPVILLVEDDDAIRRALQLLLVSRGYDVRAFCSAAGLVEAPETMKAEGLIVDLVIPDGDGVHLLEEMRAAGWAGPSILISGHLTEDRTARATRAGFDMVLAKPFAPATLLNSLDRMMDGHAPSRAGHH